MESLCKPLRFRMSCMQTKGKPHVPKEGLRLSTKGQPKLSNGSLYFLEQILLPKLYGNHTETKGNSTSSYENRGKPQETPLKAFKNQRFLMESFYKSKENRWNSKENQRFLMESLCKPKEPVKFKRKPAISNGIPLQTKGNPKISN